MSSIDRNNSVLEELPSAYRCWRSSWLGRITDTLEQQLILAIIGPVTDLDVLDVGCGDGEFAVVLADSGARVTAVDPNDSMLAAARARFEAAGAKVRVATRSRHGSVS